MTKHRMTTESHNGGNNKKKRQQQQQNHGLRTESSLSHLGALMHCTGNKS